MCSEGAIRRYDEAMGGLFKRTDVAFRRHRLNPVDTRAAADSRRDYSAVCARELSLLANTPLIPRRRPRR
jgi:hypothetical protein